MKTQKPQDVVRAGVEAFNDRDWKAFEALHAPNARYDEVGSGRTFTGRDEITASARAWTEAFPDVKGTISNIVASGDTVLAEITYKGTHEGELVGPGGSIGPTGEKINTRCAEVFRIADGLVVEYRNYFDMLDMLQALGAIPARAAKKAGA